MEAASLACCDFSWRGVRFSTPVIVKPLFRHRRQKHDLAIRSSALTRRPLRQLPRLLLLPLPLALQAPIALLDPLEAAAQPHVRPKPQETEAVVALEAQSHQCCWDGR
jgi:hypothetical protein